MADSHNYLDVSENVLYQISTYHRQELLKISK
jgi:hypothetical protein